MLALVVTVPASEGELASDALWALGVAAIEERPADGDTDATEDHFVELWTSLGDDVDAVTRAAEAFPKRWRWRTVTLDPAVAESWRAHAVPSWVDADLVIVPAWQDVPTPPTVLRVDIDPGAAFGLGDHPTTILSAAAAARGAVAGRQRARRRMWQRRARHRRRAARRARTSSAIDISPAAVSATDANARRNSVAGAVTASTTPLAAIDEQFDIVLANLLAPVLVDVAADLRRVTAPGGALIVSGVLEASHDHVVEALAPMRVVDSTVREAWAALLLRH